MQKNNFSLAQSLIQGINIWLSNISYFFKAMNIIVAVWIPAVAAANVVDLPTYFINPGSYDYGNQFFMNILVLGTIFIILYIMLLNRVKKAGFDLHDEKEVSSGLFLLSGRIYVRLILLALIFLIAIGLYTSLGAYIFFILVDEITFLASRSVGLAAGGIFGISVLSLGVYFVLRFFFSSYVIVDKKVSVLEALKISCRLTEGATLKLFVVFIFWLLGVVLNGGLHLVVGTELLFAFFSLLFMYIAVPLIYSVSCITWRQLEDNADK